MMKEQDQGFAMNHSESNYTPTIRWMIEQDKGFVIDCSVSDHAYLNHIQK